MTRKINAPSRHEVWKMFDAISPTYDRVNRVMTLGMDQLWRKKMSAYLPGRPHLRILDCATGTGDQIIALMESGKQISSIVGVDLAEAMVEIAREKIKKKPYTDKVDLQIGSALALPFADQSFDCVTISFGIRNVTDMMAAFQEFRRVLRPGGRLLILEGTIPRKKWLRSAHLFYLRHFLPRIGGLLSRNFDAYRYLNETIETFPQGERFCGLLRAAGFYDVHHHPLLGGVVTVYRGDKDAPI